MRPRQVQDFIPTPMAIATAMYYTGIDPLTMEPVAAVRDLREKRMMKALLFYWDPEHHAARARGAAQGGSRGPHRQRPASASSRRSAGAREVAGAMPRVVVGFAEHEAARVRALALAGFEEARARQWPFLSDVLAHVLRRVPDEDGAVVAAVVHALVKYDRLLAFATRDRAGRVAARRAALAGVRPARCRRAARRAHRGLRVRGAARCRRTRFPTGSSSASRRMSGKAPSSGRSRA